VPSRIDPPSLVGVKSAVPLDWPTRRKYLNDRTRRPAKATSPSGQSWTFTIGLEIRKLPLRDEVDAPCALYVALAEEPLL
jgi:hypothetical protein